MNLSLLLCGALLFAVPVVAQPSLTPAVPSPKPEITMPRIRVECTPASRAADLVGQHGCVSGRVFRITYTRTGAVHVSLCPVRSNCSFHAVAEARDSRTIGDLSYLRGQIVAVIGDVTESRGHPRIVIKNREQFQVAAGGPPQEFDAARPRANGKSFSGSNRVW